MTRKKSFRHTQLNVLSYRTQLLNDDKETLKRLESGFRGEVLFDDMLSDYPDIIHVKDVLFAYDNNREIQVDNIIVAHDVCYILEVKNFSFNLKVDSRGFFFYENGKECSLLNTQAERQKDSVRQLISDIGYPMPIHHYLVFINPDQMIYGLESRHPIITRNTLGKFLVNHMKGNRKNYDFFETAIDERRLKHSKHDHYYDICLNNLKKGVFCPKCYQRMRRISRYRYHCGICLKYVGTVDAIKLLIRDIKSLNPEYKLNSLFLSSLSDNEISSSAIRRHRLKDSIDY